MISLTSLLLIGHIVGVALAVGAATTKVVLLLRCGADHSFVPAYLQVVRSLTRLIIVGTVLLAVTGVGWLLLGYGLPSLLIVKVALFVVILVLGPIIDNVVEPRFRSLAPETGQTAAPAFLRSLRQYTGVETLATLLFYVIIFIWVRA